MEEPKYWYSSLCPRVPWRGGGVPSFATFPLLLLSGQLVHQGDEDTDTKGGVHGCLSSVTYRPLHLPGLFWCPVPFYRTRKNSPPYPWGTSVAWGLP